MNKLASEAFINVECSNGTWFVFKIGLNFSLEIEIDQKMQNVQHADE